MKVAVFTSNQPRHVALIERLSAVADEVVAVQECAPVFPAESARSSTMTRYFAHVREAEAHVFGGPRVLPSNVRCLPLGAGDLNRTPLDVLAPALADDVETLVVFGASFIKGELCRRLVERRAVNLHLGVSPYYRGSATNFWALYDGRPDLVGATIHLLTSGLDSGPILFHAFPEPGPHEPFLLGMLAAEAGQRALVKAIASGKVASIAPVPQDRSLCLRNARAADFSDEVAADYLAHLPTAEQIETALRDAATTRAL